MELSLIWTIGKFLIKLTKSQGKKWLKETFNIDDEAADLAYEGIENPAKLLDLIILLKKDKSKLENIHEKAIEVQTQKEIKGEKLLLPGLKLEYYFDLLENIFYVATIRGEIIVLEGFFNGKNYISYYSADSVSEITIEDSLYINTHAHIKILNIENQDERRKKIKTERNNIHFAKTPYDKFIAIQHENAVVDVKKIYENTIETEPENTASHNNLIRDTKGFTTMKKSLKQYIDDIIKNLEQWETASKNI